MRPGSGTPTPPNAYEPRDRGVGPGGTPLPPSGGIAAAGTVCGAAAGALMWLALMSWSASTGQGFWAPLQLVGGAFLGLRAALGGAGPGVLGAALTLLTSAFWGVLFAALVSAEMKPRQAFWAGLAYGVAVWAAMSWVGLPILDRTLEARLPLMAWPWFVCHLVYGGALLYTPALRRRFSEQDLS